MLAIICAFSLVACGGQEEATKVAEGFLTELCELDVEGMTPYFETPEKRQNLQKTFHMNHLWDNCLQNLMALTVK